MHSSSQYYMQMGGQIHAPTAFTPREKLRCPRTVLDSDERNSNASTGGN
jgi:hypothetical protein